MAYRLFQNSNKTQPITEAGVSVGYSERKQGTVDALQATAFSKPLLGRWPKGGVRNYSNYAQAVENKTYWPDSSISNGLTINVLARGVEGGVPYLDLQFVGVLTSSNGQAYVSGISGASRRIAELEKSYTASITARLLSGAQYLQGAQGLRVQSEGASETNSYREGTNSGAGIQSLTDVRVKATHKMVHPETVNTRLSLFLQGLNGNTYDVTYRVKGLQFEEGTEVAPLQFNYGPNNITEPGVEDEWFLYNDGNDSLNTQPLQSGDFSVTSVDIYGNMDNKPIVNSSGGSINSLVKERQRDVIVRSPPLIPSELEQVQAYWKAKGYKTEWSPLLLMSTQTDGHWSRGYNPNID